MQAAVPQTLQSGALFNGSPERQSAPLPARDESTSRMNISDPLGDLLSCWRCPLRKQVSRGHATDGHAAVNAAGSWGLCGWPMLRRAVESAGGPAKRRCRQLGALACPGSRRRCAARRTAATMLR